MATSQDPYEIKRTVAMLNNVMSGSVTKGAGLFISKMLQSLPAIGR
jgi:hypothetical protein